MLNLQSRYCAYLRSSLHSSTSRANIYIGAGYLSQSLEQRMTDTIPQTRSRPDSPDGNSPRPPVEKKLKLETKSAHIVEEQQPTQSRGKQAMRKARKKKQKHEPPEPYSNEDVLWRDVIDLLGNDTIDQATERGTDWESPFEHREEVTLIVSSISSSGEGLGILPAPRPPWVVVVPFALPGETVRARVYRSSRMHSFADLLNVEVVNPIFRDQSRVKCKYFGTCAGCQYQSLSYETQLDLKRNVVAKAYTNFSDLPNTSIPVIGSTIPSPLQYGYRTKITPHFEAPPKKHKHGGTMSADSQKPDWLKIGFNQIGKRQVMDIEECPIATPILNEALRPMRENIIQNIYSYKKGVSLLLRDSLEVQESSTADLESSFERRVCVTDHRAPVRERVGDKLFEYPGGSFFQNNNSVLVPLTTYVRDAIFPSHSESIPKVTHLVDAYCGSGLFAITLSPHFEQVAGIELSADSIRSATHNAGLNNLPPGKCTFRAGDAADIFSVVGEFPRDSTVTIIDPPRKGTDDNFIEQLMNFGCGTIVYVSCNVHTQARDVGKIITKTVPDGRNYVLESVRGFDLFPQTAHVESIAVLRLAVSKPATNDHVNTS